MATDAPPALTDATLRRTQTTRTRAREALRRLDRDGHPITFAAVAVAADVSRSLLYSDPTLRAEIEAHRTTRPAGANQPPVAQRASDDSLHQRLAAALDDNHALRAENQLLRDQLAISPSASSAPRPSPPVREAARSTPATDLAHPVDDMSLTQTRRSQPQRKRPLQITMNGLAKRIKRIAISG